MRKFALFLCAVSAWGQTTINGNRSLLGRLDLSGAVGFIPPTVVSDPSGACTPMVNGRSQVVLSLASGNLFSCVSSVWRLTGNPQVQSGGTGLTARNAINVVAPLVGSDNAGQGRTDISLAQSGATTNGYLSSTDWATFNGKQNALGYVAENSAKKGAVSGYAPLDTNALVPVANLPAAGPTTSGALSTTDWNTFNNKQAALGFTAENSANKGGVSGYAPLDASKHVPLVNLGTIPASQISGIATSVVTNGLLADYWMTNCDGTTASGTTMTDCSGNGNNATIPTGGNPAFTVQGLTWNAISSIKNVPLPAAVFNNFITAQIYADSSLPNNYANTAQINALLSNGTNPIMWASVQNSTPLCCGFYSKWTNSGNGTQTIDPFVGPNLMTYVGDLTQDTIYIGPQPAVNYYARMGTMVATASRTGSLLLGGNGGTGQMFGTIYRALFYNRALTAAEVAQNDAAINQMMNQRGVFRGGYKTNTNTNNLICIGDSITQGKGATPACGNTLLTGLNGTFNIYNMGMSGELAANMLLAAQKFTTGVNPSAQNNLVWVFAGTNDMCTATAPLTAAQTFQKLAGLARYMRSPFTKVIVVPMLSRTGSYQSTTCDALKNQYNALIVANWPSFADAFAWSVYSDANLTADNAYSNTTYFQSDGIHPTLAGQTLIANDITQDLNSMIAGTFIGNGYREAVSTKTASYTLTLADSMILCNATAGAVTLTLPSSVGLLGRYYQVKKVDSSANACTVNTTSSQTVDGAATVTLSTQYASKKVESDNANWLVVQ